MSDQNSAQNYLTDLGGEIDIPSGTDAFYTPLEVPPLPPAICAAARAFKHR